MPQWVSPLTPFPCSKCFQSFKLGSYSLKVHHLQWLNALCQSIPTQKPGRGRGKEPRISELLQNCTYAVHRNLHNYETISPPPFFFLERRNSAGGCLPTLEMTTEPLTMNIYWRW